ncbi:hypothetical protein ACQ4PT_046359 [Festuca glaucescens]
MKLLVNSKSHRVLYAEAGKDVVDFLFSLLTLPLAGCRGQHHGRLRGGGFVQGVAYTVMDDLKVAPMSTISGITLLNTFGITDIGSLQEKTVQLGYPERPDPFKLLLTETNIGLNSSEIKMTSTEKGITASKLSMKLLVNSKSHRVLYAEAGKDVVDFLFSLLTLPLAGRRGQHHGRLRG